MKNSGYNLIKRLIFNVINFIQNIRGIIFFTGLALNTIFWLIPIIVCAMAKVLLPISIVKHSAANILMKIGENWVSVNSCLIKYVGSVHIKCNNTDRLKRDGWYLVIANHQTWVDILILQTVFNRKIPLMKFFIKQELMWFPLLGIAFWALDMPYMKRYSPSYLSKNPHKKGKDLEMTKSSCNKFQNNPTSVFNFLEGTRFSKTKNINRKSPYKNLLQPKAGGIAIVFSTMGTLFNSLIDVTLVYPNKDFSFWDLCCGKAIEVIVDMREIELEPWLLNNDYENDRIFRKKLHLWLGDLWKEKDENIEKILKNYKN